MSCLDYACPDALDGEAFRNQTPVVQTVNLRHGVRSIQCPEGELGKAFIVVVNRAGPIARVKRFLRHAA